MDPARWAGNKKVGRSPTFLSVRIGERVYREHNYTDPKGSADNERVGKALDMRLKIVAFRYSFCFPALPSRCSHRLKF